MENFVFQGVNSAGLNRWGHFSSSKRSAELHEPIYLNLWTAELTADNLPEGMLGMYNQEDINVVFEGLRSIGGLETQPGMGGADQQQYKYADRGYAKSKPVKTHLELDLTFDLNVRRNGNINDNYTYKFLRRWVDLTYDPLTGKMGIKKTYAAKAMTILLHDKEGLPIHQWICYNLFPMGPIQAPQLSYDNGEIWKGFQIKLWADTFDEAVL